MDIIFFEASIRNRLEVEAFSKSTFDFLSVSIFSSQSNNIKFLIVIKKNIKRLHNVFM